MALQNGETEAHGGTEIFGHAIRAIYYNPRKSLSVMPDGT
jgi:hypothetical protein